MTCNKFKLASVMIYKPHGSTLSAATGLRLANSGSFRWREKEPALTNIAPTRVKSQSIINESNYGSDAANYDCAKKRGRLPKNEDFEKSGTLILIPHFNGLFQARPNNRTLIFKPATTLVGL
jgi:hypothetical protein